MCCVLRVARSKEKFRCCVASSGQFTHLGTTKEYIDFCVRPSAQHQHEFKLSRSACTFADYPAHNQVTGSARAAGGG